MITTNLSISYISYRSENMNRNYFIKFPFIDTLNVYQFGNWFESSRWLWIKSMHFFIFYIVYMLFVSMLRLTILLQLEIYDTISAGNPHVLPFNKLRTFFIIVIDVVQFNKVYHLIIDKWMIENIYLFIIVLLMEVFWFMNTKYLLIHLFFRSIMLCFIIIW